MRQRMNPQLKVSTRELNLKTHLEVMEEQMKVAAKEIKDKHEVQLRLKTLIEREGRRFKLRIPNPEMQKKNQIYFDRARQLPTFVDCKDLVQKANLLNDNKILQQLKSNKFIQHRSHFTEEGQIIKYSEPEAEDFEMQEPFPTKSQIEQLGYKTIDLVGQLPRAKSIDPSSLKQSKALIIRARQAVECLQTYQEDNLHYWLRKHIRSEYPEQELEPEFFRIQTQKMLEKSPKSEKLPRSCHQHKTESKQMVQDLINGIKENYAIDLNNKRQIDLNQINLGFQTKSNQIVKHIRQNGLRKISENISSRSQQLKSISNTDRFKNDNRDLSEEAKSKNFGMSSIRHISKFNPPTSLMDDTHKIIREVEQTYLEFMQDKKDDKFLLKSLDQDINEIQNKISKKPSINSLKIKNHIEDLNYSPPKHSKVNHFAQALKKQKFSYINNYS